MVKKTKRRDKISSTQNEKNTKKKTKINTKIKNVEICETQTPEELFNLSDVKYGDNKLYIKQKNEIIQFPIKKNIPFLYNFNKLSEGGYGHVYLIQKTHKNKKYSLIIKLPVEERDEEEEMRGIKLLKEHKVDCGIINARIMNINNFKNITIMNKMHGDLSSIRGKLTLQNLPKLLKACVECFQCLVSKGLGYIDIKTGNLLYYCDTKDNFTIKLGDIGSINKLGTKAVATYIPFEQKDDIGSNIKITESGMVFLTALMILHIIDNKPWNENISILFTPYLKDNTEEFIATEINNFLYKHNLYKLYYGPLKNKTFDLLLHKMLDLDPKKRPTFQEILIEM